MSVQIGKISNYILRGGVGFPNFVPESETGEISVLIFGGGGGGGYRVFQFSFRSPKLMKSQSSSFLGGVGGLSVDIVL